MDFHAIRLLILDVDGVLTDGRLTVVSSASDPPTRGGEAAAIGDRRKTFHVHDGRAIKQWRARSGRVAILSGRPGPAVKLRARELGVDCVRQGDEDKLDGYRYVLSELGVRDADVAYIGDDLPDLAPMSRCALPVAVANAAPEVKRAACWVTRTPGGFGAVAEVVEGLLRRQGRWRVDASG